MELTKIVIKNYKSIQSPVTISFSPNMPTVLIGKNGCGKTTILEALNYIGEANEEGSNGIADLSYRAYFKLSDNERAEVPGDVVCNGYELVMYGDEGKRSRLDRKPSKEGIVYCQIDIDEIRNLNKELREEIDGYYEQYGKSIRQYLQSSRFRRLYNLSVYGKGYPNEETKEYLDNFCYELDEQIKKLEKELDEEPVNFRIYEESIVSLDIDPCWSLEYVPHHLNDLERRYITIDREGIEKELNRINKETAKRCERITSLSKQITDKINVLLKNLTKAGNEQRAREEAYESYLREVRTTICRKCLFFKNENNEVLFQPRKSRFGSDAVAYIRNTPILMTYFESIYQGEDKQALLQLLQKDQLPPEHALKMFEKRLNENIPEFDKEAYKRITVEPCTDGNISIILHEQTGIQVDLNQTSAGRRWYFTYWFLKKTMPPGDLFIIDEPAAMLHPSAQKEILKDIEALAQKGIKVVYSTHSPYLIPKEWQSVHCVTMTEEGTKVDNSLSNRELTDWMKETIGTDIFVLSDLISKYETCDVDQITRNAYKLVIDTQKKQGIKNQQIACDQIGISLDTLKSWNQLPQDNRGNKNEDYHKISLENLIKVLRWAEKTFEGVLN